MWNLRISFGYVAVKENPYAIVSYRFIDVVPVDTLLFTPVFDEPIHLIIFGIESNEGIKSQGFKWCFTAS